VIAVAMRCPCGANAVVDINGAGRAEHRWSCHCPRCYDGAEDSSGLALLIGYGASPEDAISAWWEMVEQAWEIDYSPATIFSELDQQIAAERRRTEGWALRDGTFAPSDQWWGPSLARMAGEP
jgi:hypothetical protein